MLLAIKKLLKPQICYLTGAFTVIGLTFFVRLYKITSPIWLDEIYTYHLTRDRLEGIIQNSWNDAHPPFYFIVQWYLSNAVQFRSEIVLRSLSLLSGVLFVLVMWFLLQKITDNLSAFVFGLVLAVSPTLVYFSQEARPVALVTLLSALSTLFVILMLNREAVAYQWAVWIVASLLGLYTGYAYIMILGVQLIFLGLKYYRRLVWWLSFLVIVLGLLALTPFAVTSLTKVASFHATSKPLTLWRTLQVLLAGEPLRYGYSLSHIIVPLIILSLIIFSFLRMSRILNRQVYLYIFIQATLPFLLYFGLIKPILNIRMPLGEAKQFTVLLPSLFALSAIGLNEVYSRTQTLNSQSLKFGLAFAVGVVLIAGSVIGLQSYWKTSKSPEGEAVISLKKKSLPGERVVSLHHSVTYALYYYSPETEIYLLSDQNDNDAVYQLIKARKIFEKKNFPEQFVTIDQIRKNERFWIVSYSGMRKERLDDLLSGCNVTKEARIPPFDVLLVQNCTAR